MPEIERCVDCGDIATTRKTQYGYTRPVCEDCNKPTYLLCGCGLETRVRCAEIGCPDSKRSTQHD